MQLDTPVHTTLLLARAVLEATAHVRSQNLVVSQQSHTRVSDSKGGSWPGPAVSSETQMLLVHRATNSLTRDWPEGSRLSHRRWLAGISSLIGDTGAILQLVYRDVHESP